jgi:predicted enzyme related to lactoylglutathione lyase
MRIRWLTVFLDFPGDGFERGTAFWREVTGSALSPFRGPGGEFATLLPADGDPYLRVQRTDEGPARYHLDLHVDLTAEPGGATSRDAMKALDGAAAEAVGLGARVSYREPGEVIIVDSPGGFTFCLVPWDGERAVPAPLRAGDGATSRVTRLFLDSPSGGFERECDFWSALTGWPVRAAGVPGYAFLDQSPGLPIGILFQRREQAAPADRVTAHVDFAVQDREQVIAQHQASGARVAAEHSDWTVMTDPANHAYCLCSC